MWRYLIAGALAVSPAMADSMIFPVDCVLGETCVIQQYVDRNPGPGVADFTCGPLTYDGHKGTDIRLPDRVAMERGVDVLSATPGRVLGIRDGMPDIRHGKTGAPNVKGRECGNGVLVERADGWRFQYCHLKRDTVTVRKGEDVQPGDKLGQIGLSGKTQFPHLHLTVRDQAGRIMDPFDARQQDEACSLKDRKSLWQSLSALDYQPGGPLAAGFADAVPDYEAVRAGEAHQTNITRNAPALVFWAHFFGLRGGDQIRLRLEAPDGSILAADTHAMTRNRATQFRAIGKRNRGTWKPGTYVGAAELVRNAQPVDAIKVEIIIQ